MKEQTQLMDLDFIADNTGLLAETKSKLQEKTTNLEEAAEKVGLRISTVKTKMMQIGIHSNTTAPITLGQQHIYDIDHFTYLGSVVTNTGNLEVDVNYRIGKVAVVFQQMW